MTTLRQPVFFISHGGGPWPWVDGMKDIFAQTARELAALPAQLPARPRAALVITGHWEEREFTVSTARHPGMEYDYSGFPAHTYQLKYSAPGSPELAARVTELLASHGITAGQDPRRGFDHGTFVPLWLMYPEADVPVVMLSMKSGYDPEEHLRVGAMLAPLRDEGVLIIGSGLTYHNMRGFGRDESTSVAQAFEDYLNRAIEQPDASVRNRMLVHWEDAPAARLAHPREDHLVPLMVVAGAAGQDVGRRVFVDHAMKVAMASYEFGTLPAA
ncbi:aromatic ring-opening dioxygenase catalytic subunit (LigB family) [Luteibacter sp. Sphag1AF]|uniref:DODA-type extradiol aromatic ring-opening family dioxygenase n=1 Tax=Luteibacter sp. Sphag1AF TaxID=2587031 RepID=UPI001610FEB7|nr:class III extradiol ring-cleavage dioxygenase [Luteibacter sp. Sphag1AF]MBB3228548.1 aromatic ring-opening dioxygenase catalytic subunit (LigB family) [Luteibacter sp. Sphag1AF]